MDRLAFHTRGKGVPLTVGDCTEPAESKLTPIFRAVNGTSGTVPPRARELLFTRGDSPFQTESQSSTAELVYIFAATFTSGTSTHFFVSADLLMASSTALTFAPSVKSGLDFVPLAMAFRKL